MRSVYPWVAIVVPTDEFQWWSEFDSRSHGFFKVVIPERDASALLGIQLEANDDYVAVIISSRVNFNPSSEKPLGNQFETKQLASGVKRCRHCEATEVQAYLQELNARVVWEAPLN